MNRLFWKFLLAFWSTLLIAGLAVGYAYDQMRQAERMAQAGLDGGPRSRMLLDSAEATLRHGGVEALRDLVRGEDDRHDEPVYVVDAAGRDLLGRAVPPASLESARQARSGRDRPVRNVSDASGRQWLMFIATDSNRPRPGFAGGPGGAAGPGGAVGPGSAVGPGGFGGPGGPGPGLDEGPPPGAPPGPPPRRDGQPPPPPGAQDGGNWRQPGGPGPGPGPESRSGMDWVIGQLLPGALASLACAALLAWYMTRPIRTLRAAFEAAARGRLDTRVKPLMGRRRDEIADLGADFDRMVQKVQALVASQRRLLHDVSHELRSPLARIQAATGLARQNPARLDATLDRIDREAARLDHLIGQMLALSRLEAGTDAEPLADFDLSDVIDAIVDDARFEARSEGPLRARAIEWHRPGELPVRLHAESLHRALENVLRNALKFTAPGTLVEVIVARQSNARVRIEIADRGPGLQPGEHETLFQPFHRGAGAKGIDGFGLGLAIAKNAVELDGGTIEALPRAGGGLVIRIDLPLRAPTAVSDA